MKLESQIQKRILEYIKSSSRNKVIICKNNLALNALNIGFELSKELRKIDSKKQLSIKANSIIDEMFREHEYDDEEFGKIVVIENLGILFEKDLKIDFEQLIEKHSKGRCLFIDWPGEIEDQNIYFLSKKNGIKIILKNISHIII